MPSNSYVSLSAVSIITMEQLQSTAQQAYTALKRIAGSQFPYFDNFELARVYWKTTVMTSTRSKCTEKNEKKQEKEKRGT